MLSVKESFSKNGYSYELLRAEMFKEAPFKQNEVVGVAIYKQTRGSLVCFETFYLKYAPAMNLNGYAYEESLNCPSNEEWGRLGWTFTKHEEAQRKYIELLNRASTKLTITVAPKPAWNIQDIYLQ